MSACTRRPGLSATKNRYANPTRRPPLPSLPRKQRWKLSLMKVAVILPAAGLGTRMGKGPAEKAGTSRKQFMLLEGSPIIIHTVRKFAANPRIGEIVVAVREEDIEWVRDMLSGEFGARVRIVAGGNSRQESVEN